MSNNNTSSSNYSINTTHSNIASSYSNVTTPIDSNGSAKDLNIQDQNQHNFAIMIEALLQDKIQDILVDLNSFKESLEQDAANKLESKTQSIRSSLNKDFNSLFYEKNEEFKKTLDIQVNDIKRNLKTQVIITTNKEVSKQVDKTKSELSSITEKAEKEIESTRNSVISTIAMFAAFFTFISVNVNIFSKASSIGETLIVTLIMWSCILGFLTLFFYFLNKKVEKGFKTLFCIIFLCNSITLGFYAYFMQKQNENIALQHLSKNNTLYPLNKNYIKAVQFENH